MNSFVTREQYERFMNAGKGLPEDTFTIVTIHPPGGPINLDRVQKEFLAAVRTVHRDVRTLGNSWLDELSTELDGIDVVTPGESGDQP